MNWERKEKERSVVLAFRIDEWIDGIKLKVQK